MMNDGMNNSIRLQLSLRVVPTLAVVTKSDGIDAQAMERRKNRDEMVEYGKAMCGREIHELVGVDDPAAFELLVEVVVVVVVDGGGDGGDGGSCMSIQSGQRRSIQAEAIVLIDSGGGRGDDNDDGNKLCE